MLNLSNMDVHNKVVNAFAPEISICPRCGAWSPRNEIRSRYYWEANLHHVSVTEVRAGCYLCPDCPPGEQWFTLLPADFRTKRQYTVLSHQILVDIVKKHRMSVEEAAAFGRNILHLEKLDATTLLEWVRNAGETVDTSTRMKESVEAFSGEMALDEVYDAGWYQLKATDPLNGIELAWKLERGNPSEDDVRSFLLELKANGFEPQLVVTDGSLLYPAVIAEVWPGARHQRCVFHFIKQVNSDLGKTFWKAYNSLPKPPKRTRGRPKRRGRPRTDNLKKENRCKVKKARFLFLKRDSRLTDKERKVLDEAIELCSPLGTLRSFVVKLHELFGPSTRTAEIAEERRQAILANPEFTALESLSKAVNRLRDNDLFIRLTRYLDFEDADKTSNHVERENREFRNRQKSHYRMRSPRSLRALLDLLLVRRPVPQQPRKLRKKAGGVTITEEVRQAA